MMTNKGTGAVKFAASSSTDDMVKNGLQTVISVRLHCISCMREYKDKSLEELRLEDYLANRKGPQQMSGGLFGSYRNDKFRPFGSTDNSLTGNSNPFGSTEDRSPFVKPGPFTLVNNSPFGNTNSFGSTGNKTAFGNTSIFGSTESNPPFGNTSVAGSTKSKHPFGNTSMIGFTANKPNFGNTSTFSCAGSNPDFGNANIFGFDERKPCFGNTNTFTAVARTGSETQSPTFKSTSSPNKLQNKPTFGIEAPLFNLSSKITTSLNSSSTSSTRRTKQISTLSKSRNVLARLETVAVPNGTTKASSDIAQEAVQFVGIEKFNFSLSSSKTPGSKGEFILQNPASENHEEGMKKLVSDLQGLIECPVCFGSLDSSLKQCENGHGICGSCFNNVEKCPSCQRAYLPDKPILLWQILDRMPKPCSFTDKGCDEIFLNRKEEHETFCKFRPTSCKFQSCEWKGTVKAVTDHVRICKKSTEYDRCEIHFPNVKITQVYKFDKTQDVSLYSAVVFDNQLFWKYFHRDSSSKIISYKFYHMTPYKPKQKYYLVVSFNKGEIEFKTSVAASFDSRQPEGKKVNEISFILPDEDLERFYDVEAKGYIYTQQVIVEDICDKKNPM